MGLTLSAKTPFTPAQLFALAADIESYPSFLPWFTAARITERQADQLSVQQVVRIGGLTWRFRSTATLQPPHTLTITSSDSPFKHLEITWHFEESPGGSRFIFHLDQQFSNPIQQALADRLLPRMTRRITEAFQEKAVKLYGSDKNSAS